MVMIFLVGNHIAQDMTMTTKLSKSKILSGLQCKKRLWLEVHHAEAKVVPADVEHRFMIGHAVGEVACSLHKDGSFVEWNENASAALSETKRLLKEHPEKPIFEATFAHEGVLIRADILKKEAGGYHLIEVKSGTSVKEPNYHDCAVQVWVLEGCGLPVGKVELAHIHNKFVYGGDGDYRGLFRHEDLAGDIAQLKTEVSKWVKKLKKVLAGKEPNIATGAHCNTPYPCPFIDYCSGPGTEYPLSVLPRGKRIAKELEAEGITDIRDIPPGRLHSETQEWVRRVTITGKPEIKSGIKKVMAGHAYPRYYLDFETTRFAVPIWKDTQPYQTLPFQWSCHVEAKPGELTHKEFLDTTGDSPMRPFIESLLRAVGNRGPIFVYSGFEETQLRALAIRFPELDAGIKKVVTRLVDLLPVTKQYYYHPDMHGSWSLKAVLPTIAPDLDYGDLGDVQDGGAAEIAYQEIIHPDTEPQRSQSLAADLRAYCQRDTEALIALVRFLLTGKIQRFETKQAN